MFIHEGPAKAPPPLMAGPMSNSGERAEQIGKGLMKANAERRAEEMPYTAPAEPTKSAEDFIKAGLGAERARREAAAKARAEAAPKVRRSWR